MRGNERVRGSEREASQNVAGEKERERERERERGGRGQQE